MKIGSLLKQSFIDWEGKLCAVVFTQGCNFRCGYCHNPSLVLPELFHVSENISEADVLSYLKSRTGWLDGVVITGGEPTVHTDLTAFIRKIKQLGFAIKLDTNGTNPQLLKELVDEKLIDYVAMDIKSVLIQSEYEKVTGIVSDKLFQKVLLSVDILRSGIIPYQFRTTILPEIHSAEKIAILEKAFSNYEYNKQSFRNDYTIVREVFR